jgi:hypothetical protein
VVRLDSHRSIARSLGGWYSCDYGDVSDHRRGHNADPRLGVVHFRQARRPPAQRRALLSLLPGDIKYESPSGNFRFYFPITNSIVISIVLTLVLWLFS